MYNKATRQLPTLCPISRLDVMSSVVDACSTVSNPIIHVLPRFHILHVRFFYTRVLFMVTHLKYPMTSCLISKLDREYIVTPIITESHIASRKNLCAKNHVCVGLMKPQDQHLFVLLFQMSSIFDQLHWWLCLLIVMLPDVPCVAPALSICSLPVFSVKENRNHPRVVYHIFIF